MQLQRPKILTKRTVIQGTHFITEHTFKDGHVIPIFEADTMHGLNQLIGKLKYINKDYGNVFYRGECALHDNLLPSLLRKRSSADVAISSIGSLRNSIISDFALSHFIGVKDPNQRNYQIEGMLQHYGIATRFIDIVDNHWIALWMGLNECKRYKIHETYYHYSKREWPMMKSMVDKKHAMQDLYQYVLLIAMPQAEISGGVQKTDEFMLIDLRQALPSTFLRPHAQHGLVMRKICEDTTMVQNYDLASEVVGIVRIRIDKTDLWLGGGLLLSQDNLFPAPAYDTGYDVLLQRNDIFKLPEHQIAKYV